MTAHMKQPKGEPHYLTVSKYMIETTTRLDEERCEFVTFSLCLGEVPAMPEQMLDRRVAQKDKDEVLRLLKDIRENQLPNYGTEIRCRIFKIVDQETRRFADSEERAFVLKPLFDLCKDKPVPCIG